MGMDAPRTIDVAADEVWVGCRVRLLALAGALDDLGVRARIAEPYGRPVMLRCWDPERQRRAVSVSCAPSRVRGGRLTFRRYPGGEVLADAQDALQPGDTADLARTVAALVAKA